MEDEAMLDVSEEKEIVMQGDGFYLILSHLTFF